MPPSRSLRRLTLDCVRMASATDAGYHCMHSFYHPRLAFLYHMGLSKSLVGVQNSSVHSRSFNNSGFRVNHTRVFNHVR